MRTMAFGAALLFFPAALGVGCASPQADDADVGGAAVSTDGLTSGIYDVRRSEADASDYGTLRIDVQGDVVTFALSAFRVDNASALSGRATAAGGVATTRITGAGNVACDLSFRASADGVAIEVKGADGGACGVGSHPVDRRQTLAIYAATYKRRDETSIQKGYDRLYDVGMNRAQSAHLAITAADDAGFDFDLVLTNRRAAAGSIDGRLHGRARYASDFARTKPGSGNNAVAHSGEVLAADGSAAAGCSLVFSGLPASEVSVVESGCAAFAKNVESSGMNAPTPFGGTFSTAVPASKR